MTAHGRETAVSRTERARTLLRGAHIVTLDPALGSVEEGDVLISADGRIEAIAPRLDVDDAPTTS
ncbi:MAG TPA: hypothetical protein VK875_11485 [Euzebyales bacterium]|nr:hypothetical protein [Euzebyales bacterium]